MDTLVWPSRLTVYSNEIRCFYYNVAISQINIKNVIDVRINLKHDI